VRALRYAFEEAFASLWRGRQAGVLSTLTIALALFVLGGFLIVTANLQLLGAEWSNAAELSVYLKDDVTAGERAAIEALLAPGDLIAAHEFVSKTDALARFKQTFGDLAVAVDGLGSNPLPASVEARLRPGTSVGQGVDSLAERLRQMPGVADVRQKKDPTVPALRTSATIGSGSPVSCRRSTSSAGLAWCWVPCSRSRRR
jgi:cell division transport system permease protein